MEIALLHSRPDIAEAFCNGQRSHTFDPRPFFIPDKPGEFLLPADLPTYGQALFAALFPENSPANEALKKESQRLLLVAPDPALDSIPWEYLRDRDTWLAEVLPLLRGLPQQGRKALPELAEAPLHILGIFSNPLEPRIEPLDIEAEWLRLKEAFGADFEHAVLLERSRPATLSRLGVLAANRQNLVVHFSGHGSRMDGGSVLCFEQVNGALDEVSARSFNNKVKRSAFLVVLSACVSAVPGQTEFANLARLLVEGGVPYALGMRFPVLESDANTLTQVFYQHLGRGLPVEEALFQARADMARHSLASWAVGVPVLYTSLAAPAPGLSLPPGKMEVQEHLPPRRHLAALPRAKGAFQGRIPEQIRIAENLTGDRRARVLTIHGAGGQGKTALARQVLERCLSDQNWPGGAWAISLEDLPERARFCSELALFLGVPLQEGAAAGSAEAAQQALEEQILDRLKAQRTLLVLDNTETLLDALDEDQPGPQALLAFLQTLLSETPTSLLLTSRRPLNWPEEVPVPLGGLLPEEGARLFRQHAGERRGQVSLEEAQALSKDLAGHALSLRLLGATFAVSGESFAVFKASLAARLQQAQDRYQAVDHRHRSLFACFDTSAAHLPPELQPLFSGLKVFHAPFLAETAAQVFEPAGEAEAEEGKESVSAIPNQLETLRQRSLLDQEEIRTREGTLRLYRLLPAVRLYLETPHNPLPRVEDWPGVLGRFGAACARQVRILYRELDRSPALVQLALLGWNDFERGLKLAPEEERGRYALHWGWIIDRLGQPLPALRLLESALEAAQGQDQNLELSVLNNLGLVYQAIGQPQRALEIYQQALPIFQEGSDRAGEATTLNNLGLVYDAIGKPQRALEIYQQALPIFQEVGNRAGVATTLNNLGSVYDSIGQPQRALEFFQQALPISREVGDRAGEATTLNNLGGVYRAIGQPQRALEFFQQALPISREVGDRAGEAATLNNLGSVYRAIGQPQRALEFFQQALPIRREVGDRAGEVATLFNLAGMYSNLDRNEEAKQTYEFALEITRQISYVAAEITTLAHYAALLFRAFDQKEQAVQMLAEAIRRMQHSGLPRDAAGSSLEDLQALLGRMRSGSLEAEPAGGISAALLKTLQHNTIAVMTFAAEKREEWQKSLTQAHQQAQDHHASQDAAFFQALLGLLAGNPPQLDESNPYFQVFQAVLQGIANGGESAPAEESDPTLQALGAFLNAPSWSETRQALEAHRELLAPEMDQTLDALIRQAQGEGNENALNMLKMHRVLLEDARRNGIPAAFQRLEENLRMAEGIPAMPAGTPPDFPLRCLQGLRGGGEEKMKLFQYLENLHAVEGGFEQLLRLARLAVFDEKVLEAETTLPPGYQPVWDWLREQMKGA